MYQISNQPSQNATTQLDTLVVLLWYVYVHNKIKTDLSLNLNAFTSPTHFLILDWYMCLNHQVNPVHISFNLIDWISLTCIHLFVSLTQVRAAISELALDMVSYAINILHAVPWLTRSAISLPLTNSDCHTDMQANPLVASVSLEFDASSFRMRQQLGLLQVDAKYYTFVALSKLTGRWIGWSYNLWPLYYILRIK